jgi:colanic acid/amylovoran biosynthesis glycosyltransferase
VGAARPALAARPAADRRFLLRALDPRLGRPARTLNLLAQALRYLPGERFDVIQACFGPDGIRAGKLRRIGVLRGPIVTAVRGSDLSKFLRRRGPGAYAAHFRAGELFLPVYEALAARLRSVGCPAERITVHHTGIQLRDHPFRPRALPRDRPLRLVTVERLVEKKAVACGIEVVASLAREGRAVEYHEIGDGPLRPALEAQARACPPGAVRFHGAMLLADVRAALDGMDAMLAPHVTARAAGSPRSGTWPASRGVLQLLDHPERWDPLTAAARVAMERGFDIDRLNDRLVTSYETLAPRRPTETR